MAREQHQLSRWVVKEGVKLATNCRQRCCITYGKCVCKLRFRVGTSRVTPQYRSLRGTLRHVRWTHAHLATVLATAVFAVTCSGPGNQ